MRRLALILCLLLVSCGAPAHARPRATATPAPPTPTPQRTNTEPPVWPTAAAYPAPPTAPLDLCGVIPDNGAPWYMEDGEGNPRPCPGDTPPTPEPVYPVRAWLPLVGR